MRAQEFQPAPIYYFAYGMLTNPRHMPGAEPVGPATLPNHSFEFQQFADVVPESGSRVHGVLWEIPRELLAQLDRVEGVPYLYNRKTVPVRSNGQRYEAYVYTMTPSARAEVKSAAPSQSYVRTLGQGYARFDLPGDQINQALVRAREVTEVAMNPAAYADSMTAAAERGVLVGFEFEVCVPADTMESAPKKTSQKPGIDYLWDVVGAGYASDVDLDVAGFNQLFRQTAPIRVDRRQFDSMQQYVEYEKNRLTNDVKETFRKLSEPVRQKILKQWNKSPASSDATEEQFMTWLGGTANEISMRMSWNEPDWNYLVRIRNQANSASEKETIYDFLNIIDPNRFKQSFEWDDAAVAARYRERALEFGDEEEDDYEDEYEKAARVLQPAVEQTMGTKTRVFHSYHQSRKNTTDWYIEPDGSLEADDVDDATAEIVSPPLPVQQAMADLKKFYGMARQMNLYTNETTGLHINVSIPGDLDILKLAVFLGDDYVLKAFDREDSEYARSVMQNLQRGADPAMLKKRRGRTELDLRALKKLAQDSTESHFASISDNGKYISFRHSGGDYLNNSEAITNVVGRFVRAMVIAADPTAYRSEYLKKLTGLVTSQQLPDPQISAQAVMDIRRNGVPALIVTAWSWYGVPDDYDTTADLQSVLMRSGVAKDEYSVERVRVPQATMAQSFPDHEPARDRRYGRSQIVPRNIKTALAMAHPEIMAAAQKIEDVKVQQSRIPINNRSVAPVVRDISNLLSKKKGQR